MLRHWGLERSITRRPRVRIFPGSPVVKTLCFSLQTAQVPSLVGELRSHMPRGMAKIKFKAPERDYYLGNILYMLKENKEVKNEWISIKGETRVERGREQWLLTSLKASEKVFFQIFMWLGWNTKTETLGAQIRKTLFLQWSNSGVSMGITVKVDEHGTRAQPLFFMPHPPLYFQSFIRIPQLLEDIILHSSRKVQYWSLTPEPHGQGSYMLTYEDHGLLKRAKIPWRHSWFQMWGMKMCS